MSVYEDRLAILLTIFKNNPKGVTLKQPNGLPHNRDSLAKLFNTKPLVIHNYLLDKFGLLAHKTYVPELHKVDMIYTRNFLRLPVNKTKLLDRED